MVPGTIFVMEKVYQIVKTLSRNGRSWVTAGVILPSNVVSLIIKRPPGFNFEPGQYILINIPDIAVFEWHPFTISSAPEQDDVISLHIRVAGYWTRQVYNHFQSEQERIEAFSQVYLSEFYILEIERLLRVVRIILLKKPNHTELKT